MNKTKTLVASLILGGAALVPLLLCGAVCPCSAATAQPSACRLDPGARERRVAQYRRMLRGADARLAGLEIRVALRGDPEALRRRVAAAAAAETECCTALEVTFEPTDTGGILRLSGEGSTGHVVLPLLDALR